MIIRVHARFGGTHELDTATERFGYLCALFHLYTRYRSKGVEKFESLNGEGSFLRYVRALRARIFRDRINVNRSFLAALNNYDPPNCRCGRPGTRIIGAETFCYKCGPTDRAKSRFNFNLKRQDELALKRGELISEIEKEQAKEFKYHQAKGKKRKTKS